MFHSFIEFIQVHIWRWYYELTSYFKFFFIHIFEDIIDDLTLNMNIVIGDTDIISIVVDYLYGDLQENQDASTPLSSSTVVSLSFSI